MGRKTKEFLYTCSITFYRSSQVSSRLGLGVMVFNATFNNISAILWWSVLLKEPGVPGETTDLPQVTEKNFITKCCINYISEC
jgi:hypothetical protein